MAVPLPKDEDARLAALREYNILDTVPEDAYDDITRLAAFICDTPIATISLVDEHRQWFKSILGLSFTETPRDAAFCAHTILQSDLMVVPDATQDSRFADNPLVTGDPHIRFYAGMPLTTEGGHALGALCVYDRNARHLTPEQEAALRTLARQVTNQLELARGAVITFRDITARKLAERELQGERDFSSAVIQTVGSLVVVLDRQGHIVRFNQACERLTGFSFEEIKGKKILDLVLVPEEAEAVKRVFQDMTSGQFPNSYENHWVIRDGSRRLISWSNTALLDPEGVVEFVIGTGIDITDRNRTEASLRVSEERFRQMAENINEVFWMTDPKFSQMLYINPAYETIWGRTCQSLYEQPASFVDPVHPDDRESLFADLQSNYLSGKFDTEYRIVRPDGSVRWIWARAFPIRDEQGDIYRVTGIAQDITERKMAAEELESAHIEMLERLARAGEFRDDDTGQHTKRVSDTVALLARSQGFSEDRVRWIQQASRLHDIGKIGISDLLLLKPGKLTEEEFAVMQTHTIIGGHLFEEGHSELIQIAQRIAASHHERWDGTGYPQGLRGDDIPIEARLLAVADVFDALTHERPYKKAWSVPEAIAEIKRQSGRHFDPHIVECFLGLVHEALI